MSVSPNHEARSINRPKNRRAFKRKRNFQKNLRLLSVNCNGVSSKLQSLEHVIRTLAPSVFCLQETKLANSGKIKIESSKNYVIFELTRKVGGGHGGGLAIGALKDLEPEWVSQGDDTTEVLVIQVKVGHLTVRICCAYGPQETDSIERKSLFWSRLHAEADLAAEINCEFILVMDGNLHAGDNIVPGDPNIQNSNGRLFHNFLMNNSNLTLFNGSDICDGLITRSRVKGSKTEAAVLDFALASNQIASFCRKMLIDEDRKYAISSYLRKKVVHSDHYSIILDFDISWKKKKPERHEHFNFKNPEGLQEFKKILETEDNLSKCFDNSEPFKNQFDKWWHVFDNTHHRCFNKVRATEKVKPNATSELFKKRGELIQKLKIDQNNEQLKRDLETVILDITKAVGEENSKKIHDTFSKFDQSGGANVTANLWKLKKETFPKVSPSLPAVKQDINGRLISGQKKLQKLYSDVFTHRLRHRPTINEDYEELHDLQSELLQKRMMASKHVQTPDWTEDDVVKVLRSLK